MAAAISTLRLPADHGTSLTLVRSCIVLGAGSTLANAQFFRPTRKLASHPPLDYTFFDKIAERKVNYFPLRTWRTVVQ